MNTTQGHSKYQHIGIMKTNDIETEGMPIISYAFGPYRTIKATIQAARYQFSFVRHWYFINCNRPKNF